MKLFSLLLALILLNMNTVFAADLCGSYLSIAESNAQIGIVALNDAQDSYEQGLAHHQLGKRSQAFMALKLGETHLIRGRLQLVTSLFQLERAREVCESIQTIEELSKLWNQKIEELSVIEELSGNLFDEIVSSPKTNGLNQL